MKFERSFVLLCLILLTTVVYLNFAGTVTPVPLRHGFDSFPKTIGSFTYVGSQTFNEAVLKSAGMDEYIMWQYRDQDGYTLGLYIGYYRDQTEGSIIHSPKHCMPGSGWEPFQMNVYPLRDTRGRTFEINQMVLQKGMEKQLAYYWYQGRGRVVANEYLDRAYMVLDSVLEQRSDGALVRITGPGNDLERDRNKQAVFMAALMPVLEDFLPQ